jgi:hypothetical protein
MTTAIRGGRSAQCGVPATAGTWRGGVGAAQCFTRPSRGGTADSEIEAPPRCGKTNTGASSAGIDQAEPELFDSRGPRLARAP